jgi:hypothetical protein
VQAIGEQQHARSGLAADPWESGQVVAALTHRGLAHPIERKRLADRSQDRLDARRLDLRDPARANRLLDLSHLGVAHLHPRRKELAQAQIGDVAVAVVCAL